MAVLEDEVEVAQPAQEPEPLRPPRRRWTRFILPGLTKLVMVYLMVPIAIMILYTFNKTLGGTPKVTFRWNGFTTEWYRQLLGVPDLTAALKNSLVIAFTSTAVATVLGTLMALALVRYRYRGRSATDFVMFLNISQPEVVMGAALLSLFVTINFPRGLLSIFVAHVMFNIPIVAVTVRARLAGYDTTIEDAARDLYANPLQTFTKVTLPIIWPGILAGALLAFALSIDDFVVTQFVAGTTVTFPLWVFGAVKVGIPPQVFVWGTLIFVIGVVVAAFNVMLQHRKPAM